MLFRSFVLVAVIATAACARSDGAKNHGRAAFAKALGTIKSGMTREQVRKILGDPDQILDEADCVAEGYESQTEKWDYGAQRKFDFPTLGSVEFEGDLCDGPPPHYNPKAIKDGLVEEKQLRSMMQLMYEGENVQFRDLTINADPLYTIRIANALLPLGKRKALAVVREYARVRSSMFLTDNLTVYNAVRSLFTLPPNTKMPELLDYAGVRKEIAGDPSFFSADPFIVYDDVPMLFVDMNSQVELNPLLERLATICEKSGVMRTKPLTPPNDLFALVKQMDFLPEWAAAVARITKAGRQPFEIIPKQLALLVRTAVAPDHTKAYLSQNDVVVTYPQWDDMIERSLTDNCRWDAFQQAYVSPGGNILQDEKPAYKKYLWDIPGLEEWQGHIVVLRTGDSICVKACWKARKGNLPDAVIGILGGEGGDTPLVEFHLPDGKIKQISAELGGSAFDFPEGEPSKGTFYEWIGGLHLAHKAAIQVQFGGKTITSPLFDFSS